MINRVNKFLIATYVLTTVSALILLKLGTDGGLIVVNDGSLTMNIAPVAVLGIAFYGVSFFINTILLSRFDLGFIVTLTQSFIYLAVFVFSYFIFSEEFTLVKLGGILLILSGVALLGTLGETSAKDSKSLEK